MVNPPAPVRTCAVCPNPTAAEHAPFCSRRCSEIDLHRWFSGRYAIPVAPRDEPDENAS
jgi:hypothetical protein